MKGQRFTERGGEARTDLTFFYRGRVALYAILRASGLGPGSRILLQAFTCTAVPEAILALGAIPKYVDVESGSVNMSPAALENALADGGDAVVLQHTFGIPADAEAASRVCSSYGVPLIEDCCHVAGFPRGGGLGSLGVASFFSFEWGKPIPVGIGGAAVVNSKEVSRRLRELTGGFSPPPLVRRLRLEVQFHLYRLLYNPRRYWMLRRAFRRFSSMRLAEGNYHLEPDGEPSEEFGWKMSHSVMRRVQRAESQLADRFEGISKTVKRYRDGIQNLQLQHLIEPTDGTVPALARYPLFTERKFELLKAAERSNIEVAGWYATAVHPLEGRALSSVGYELGSCPAAEAAADRVVSLPIQSAREADTNKIIRFLNGRW